MSRSYPATPRADVYSRITTEIVSAIEAGAGDWRMPWHHDGAATTRPQNVTSRRRYRGVNVLALWIVAEAAAYRSAEHTSELQSLMRISYAVFCLQKKKHK